MTWNRSMTSNRSKAGSGQRLVRPGDLAAELARPVPGWRAVDRLRSATDPPSVAELTVWHKRLCAVAGDMSLRWGRATAEDAVRWAAALRAVTDAMAGRQ
jgi:hypothetical protein